eukprot:9559177-Lingulodinium_polyedra.AAC.1
MHDDGCEALVLATCCTSVPLLMPAVVSVSVVPTPKAAKIPQEANIPLKSVFFGLKKAPALNA